MVIHILHPSKLLRNYIKYYWNLEADSTFYKELVYPTGEPQILFHYRKPFVKHDTNGSLIRQSRISVFGQSTSSQQIAVDNECGVIGAIFYPHALKFFLPFSIAEITDSALNLADIFRSAKEFEDRFLECRGNCDRVALIEKFLLNNLKAPCNTHLNIVQHSINAVMNVNGVDIDSYHLFRKSGYSERQFERIFKSFVGVSAQRFIEIIRLNNSINQLSSDLSLTQIAFESGFYDQSHFIRTFKKYTGLSPSDFRYEMSLCNDLMTVKYNSKL